MRISAQEQAAIQHVTQAGASFGFGNMISHLQTAWAKKLMDEYGMDEKTARLSSWGDGYPFKMHEDLKDHGFWDETGESYRAAKEKP